MKVSIQFAAEHFEDLVSAAQSGEAVEIECEGEPGVRLVAFSVVEPMVSARERTLGTGTAFDRLPSPEECAVIGRAFSPRS